MEIKYDTPIEVTKEQYKRVTERFRQLIAHRIDRRGRHWVKLWAIGYKEELEKELNKN